MNEDSKENDVKQNSAGAVFASGSYVETFDVYKNQLRKTKELKKEIDEIKRIFKFKEARLTEILGIFVALFTFISVDIQIFRNVSSLNNAMFFVILMFFCLLGFVFFLHGILNFDTKNGISQKSFCVLIIFLIIVMAVFFITGLFKKTTIELENTNTVNELENKIDGLEQRMNGFVEGNNR